MGHEQCGTRALDAPLWPGFEWAAASAPPGAGAGVLPAIATLPWRLGTWVPVCESCGVFPAPMLPTVWIATSFGYLQSRVRTACVPTRATGCLGADLRILFESSH